MAMRPKRSNDPVKAAHQVYLEIIGEAPPPEPEPEKNPAAVARGALGGAKGGKARAAALSDNQRSDIARKAAEARWSTRKRSD
jgi:hypothetical protein